MNDLTTNRGTAALLFVRADPFIQTGAWDHQASVSILPSWPSPNPHTASEQDVGFEKPQRVCFSKNGYEKRLRPNPHQSPVLIFFLLHVVCVPSHSGISLRVFRLVLGMTDMVRGLGEHTSPWIGVISRNRLHVCHSNKTLIYCLPSPHSLQHPIPV